MVAEVLVWRVELNRAAQRTAHGTVRVSHRHIVEVRNDDGVSGFGELAALEDATYDDETLVTQLAALEHHLLPRLARLRELTPETLARALNDLVGQRAARAALSEAVWDLAAKVTGLPIWRVIGGERRPVYAGIALELADRTTTLARLVEAQRAGYRRIKLKIDARTDVGLLRAARAALGPAIDLVADANGSLADADPAFIAAIDEVGLDLLEQPLPADELVATAALARRLQTKLCLDESIRSVANLETALALGLRPAISLKLARVGGYEAALRLLERAAAEGLSCLVGGLYESAIGRAHAVALATRPEITRVGDLSPSSRYGNAEPTLALELGPTHAFDLWNEPGIGRCLDEQRASLRLRYRVGTA